MLADGLPDDESARTTVAEAPVEAGHFWDGGGDPNDLGLQRWAVLAPQDPEGDRLLAAGPDPDPDP